MYPSYVSFFILTVQKQKVYLNEENTKNKVKDRQFEYIYICLLEKFIRSVVINSFFDLTCAIVFSFSLHIMSGSQKLFSRSFSLSWSHSLSIFFYNQEMISCFVNYMLSGFIRAKRNWIFYRLVISSQLNIFVILVSSIHFKSYFQSSGHSPFPIPVPYVTFPVSPPIMLPPWSVPGSLASILTPSLYTTVR